jgi:HEAT repeat protein
MFDKTSIAICVFVLGLTPLWAVTPDQLRQLAGKSTDGIQPDQYAQVYGEAFASLVEQMDPMTGEARYAHQMILQEMCLYAARPGAEPQRLAMAKALANTLESKTTTPEIRYWLLLQMQRTGKAEVLDVLTQSLGSADKIEQGYARAAIEKNPAPQATEILLKALAATQDDVFAAGVISSLGSRQDPKAVEAVGRHLDHTNPVIASAAVTALVKINTPEAVAILKQKLSPTHPAASAIAKGLVEIAAVSPAAQANAIDSDLYAWSGKVQPASNAYSIRKAALMGLAKNDAAGVDKMILADFNAEDPAVRSMAIAAAGAAKRSGPANAMADHSEHLDTALQNQLIVMLAARQEPSVIAPVKHAVKSNDPELLLTAADALSQMKTQEAAAMLLELARRDDIQVNKHARQKVIESGNDSMDELLLAAAAAGADKERAGAIVLLGERKTPTAAAPLFGYAQSDNKVIYESAFKAIGLSASADKIPVLCGMAEKTTVKDVKTSALSAINMILRNSQDPKAAYAVILKEIKAAEPDWKIDLLTTLKMSRDADAMDYCLGLLSEAEGPSFESPLPQTALKMLSSWSDPMPAKHLIERAKTSQHKSAYAEAALDLALNMLRYDKGQAKKIATDIKALNMSETFNESADKIINIR